ncbi:MULTISPECIES: tetratricopeptide repeat protein [Candidatus Thioglobus]|jgi:tetratricopeptide (TPR) repeat protein|nr:MULTISPECIES: tetratricopeptide repeat protein [Candidatus Thioglobus]MBT3276389.1 tetratricopeptide repeat protein [Candidatus Thioglobus sp.]MBT3446594.1 tetratricopeptide repeat protein [Candidatus Thioglobus sp.]MBT3744653.1 tetratricopeptide repeat protein [Candidatus Thioglobus sp.]MBT4001292.1 tetratricopeptide repeat protein [Candidatus Thioglobus sp.]MBT4182379.1 tetratricopeptide repeat protein [Candidatus Thioglobus sp.]
MKSKKLITLLLFCITALNYPALAKLPDSSKILQQVGQIMQDNKFKESEQKLKNIIANSPSKQAYVELANLYIGQNKNQEAIGYYQEAALLEPTDPKVFTSMSVAYLHLGFYEASKAMAQQALALKPTLEHASKIVEYIDKKQAVLARAAKAGKTN